jgi:hypothetical protein
MKAGRDDKMLDRILGDMGQLAEKEREARRRRSTLRF